MAHTLNVRELKEYRREAQAGFTQTLYRRYMVPANMTLALAGLAEGDYLDDDAAAEIVSSQFVETKERNPENRQMQPAPSRMVDVVAKKWDTE
jgi:hypothetical protein